MDLYKKLTVDLQKFILSQLDNLTTYSLLEKKVQGLYDLRQRVNKRKKRITQLAEKKAKTATVITSKPKDIIKLTLTIPFPRSTSATPKTREMTLTLNITYYNCGEKGHYASDCLQPRKVGGDLKEIEGGLD